MNEKIKTEIAYIENLLERVKVDPDKGIITWVKPLGSGKTGGECGTVDKNGYRTLTSFIDGYSKKLRTHRVIYYYHYGSLPVVIDHINQVKTDNRVSNLRESNYSLNAINHNNRSNNTSGFIGVCKTKEGTWGAKIKKDKKDIWLGTYKTKIEAINVRLKAERDLFGIDRRNILTEELR
jgi:hypothetical protein